MPSGAATDAEEWFPRLLRLMMREPTLLVGVAYLGSALIGLWSSYWFYRHFDIPVAQYFQFSDYLISGLREPISVLYLVGFLLACALAYLPTYYERRHRDAVDAFRQRWWGRLAFPVWGSPFVVRKWYDTSPGNTLMITLVIGSALVLVHYARKRAEAILAGGGQAVAVTLSGKTTPLLGEARLLGTSSGFVYLYWPANGRTEIVVQDEVARIEVLPRRRHEADAESGE